MSVMLNKSYLRERWGKVPSNMVRKLANECSKGVDWGGSTKGDILNAYICSVLWNENKIVKEKYSEHYKFDPVSFPFNPAKFEWFMDKIQLHAIEMERAVIADLRFERNGDRFINNWTNVKK